MTDTADIEGTSLTQRVVLLGLADLSAGGEVPAHAGEIRRACTERLDAVEGDVLGTLTEAEASRALNELDAAGLLAATRDDTSVTGKGRPRYDLAVDREALLSGLGDDDRLTAFVEQVTA
jgi:hypothetical protein